MVVSHLTLAAFLAIAFRSSELSESARAFPPFALPEYFIHHRLDLMICPAPADLPDPLGVVMANGLLLWVSVFLALLRHVDPSSPGCATMDTDQGRVLARDISDSFSWAGLIVRFNTPLYLPTVRFFGLCAVIVILGCRKGHRCHGIAFFQEYGRVSFYKRSSN